MGKLAGLIIFSICISLTSAAQQQVHKEIAAVLDSLRAYTLRQQKEDSAAGHSLGSRTEAYFARRHTAYVNANAQLAKIKKDSLSFEDEVNLELLLHEVRDEIAQYKFKAYLNPILSDEGFHTSLARRGNMIVGSLKEARRYIGLLQDIPRFVDENLNLMRRGLQIGISQPKIILAGYESTYNQHIVDSIEHSVFWKPFLKQPYGVSNDEWLKIKATARTTITSAVIPAYRKISDFFSAEYLPKARVTPGASAFPDGAAFYEDRVRHYTTTNLSAEEVYQVGLNEVKRIRTEMDDVIKQVNFKGDFKAFVLFLRTDPRFYPASADQLLKEASFIAKKADGKLPSLFGKLPRLPYTVAPVPAYLAPTYTTGRYSGAPANGKRAGEYWVNTYNLPSRTLYTLEALTLHEAVPGHHLQICLTQELDSLPDFRRSLYINAFGEGWGLYSEYLGHEMGFYQDPYSLFGRLTYEMWRACRLVIDVGIHAKNWTRDEAVSFLADNSALSLHEVNTEINRYISWPGQALAYKMGEIKIKEMRKRTEEALKENFDVRSFHDMVLSRGSVTLSILEKMTDRFIAEQSGKFKTLKK